MDFDRDGALTKGMLGYFPEGVRYGPQINKTPTTTAILQFGGASGSGYLQPKEVRAGMQALKQLGEFKDGVFRRRDGVPGKRNMEAYEAIWEHVTKRELVYPKPRYAAPILIDPDEFRLGRGGGRRRREAVRRLHRAPHVGGSAQARARRAP